MRRKRIETYFALYLTAIIAFLVVASERDKVNQELNSKNEKILAAFLRSAPVEPERDTLYWNVDADDRTGIIQGRNNQFNTFIRIRDIRRNDSAEVRFESLYFNSSFLADEDLIQLGKQYEEPGSDQSAVLVPVYCAFPRTGTYDITFTIHTKRIHHTATGELQYSDFTFSADLIDEETLQKVERSRTEFTIVVQDTSTPNPVPAEQIAINVARSRIVSAIGFEETNEIFLNLADTRPILRIVYGGGILEQQNGSSGRPRYFWRGTVRSVPDSIVLEVRLNRGAGGKDIARTSFSISPSEPYLLKHLPPEAYTGEEFEFNVQVGGLNNTNQYSWQAAINGEQRLSGSGPVVRYTVPSGVENAELTVTAQYEGRTYRCIDPSTNRSRESIFTFRIFRPPARIFLLSFPDECTPLQTFAFDAVRFGRNKRSNEKPIPYNDIDVRARTEDGRNLDIDLRLVAPGSYEFNLRNPKQIIRTQIVVFDIRASEAHEQLKVRLVKK